MSRPTRFTIRSVCALTGVNPNTLRAWERRYGLVRPERTASGYRLYTMDDVERLRAIQDLLNAGVPAGQVMQHLPAAAAVTVTEGSAPATEPSFPPPRPGREQRALRTPAEFATALCEAALAGDEARVERLFSRAVGLFTIRRAFPEVLLHTRRQLEEQGAQGDARAVEAARRLTEFARRRLQAVLAGLKPLHQRPLVVCAHTGSDQHESDLMRIALELGIARVSTCYLVASDGPEPLTEAANQGSVRAVVMTCCAPELCSKTKLSWQRAAERLRALRLHVVAPANDGACDWVRATGAGVLNGEADESARALLKSLGRN